MRLDKILERARLIIYEKHRLAQMKKLSYHVMLRWEPDDEAYTAWVPSLPGCVTFGKTIEEALEMSKDAIKLYVETLISLGETVPSDESVIDCTVNIEAYA